MVAKFRTNCPTLLLNLLLCCSLATYGVKEILSQGVAVPNRVARALPKVKVDIPLPKVQFEDIAAKAGLIMQHVSGGDNKKYLLESTGSGVALLDYDTDGFLDIF